MRHSNTNHRAAGLLPAALILMAGLIPPAYAQETPAHIQAAVDNEARPEADRAADASRKPADMLVFAEVEPGDIVVDMLPGGGYFTRLFGAAVGEEGHVYGLLGPAPPDDADPARLERAARSAQSMRDINDDGAFGAVTGLQQGFTEFTVPQPVDLVWTSRNYHDLHLARLGLDIDAVNARIFEALKPGGLYVVLDHSAADNAEASVADELHRYPEALAKAEIERAGFEFVAASDALRNPDDPRDIGPFDDSIRGRTDQFILKFRKPLEE